MRKAPKPATVQLGLFQSDSQKKSLPRVIDPKVVPLLVRLLNQFAKRREAALRETERSHE
jgi:hypothetical protein